MGDSEGFTSSGTSFQRNCRMSEQEGSLIKKKKEKNRSIIMGECSAEPLSHYPHHCNNLLCVYLGFPLCLPPSHGRCFSSPVRLCCVSPSPPQSADRRPGCQDTLAVCRSVEIVVQLSAMSVRTDEHTQNFGMLP